MDTFEVGIIAVIAILFVVIICYYSICKRKGGTFLLPKLLLAMLLGVGLLFPAKLLLITLGFAVNINILSVAISTVLGIPGVLLIIAIALFS